MKICGLALVSISLGQKGPVLTGPPYNGSRGRGRRPPGTKDKTVEGVDGRAIPFAELERYSKYKSWKTQQLDTKGDAFTELGDNRDMVIQQLDFLLGKLRSTKYHFEFL
jgi:hypothetical protein